MHPSTRAFPSCCSFTAGNSGFPVFDAKHAPKSSAWVSSDIARSDNAGSSEECVVTNNAIVERKPRTFKPVDVQSDTDTDDDDFGCDSCSI